MLVIIWNPINIKTQPTPLRVQVRKVLAECSASKISCNSKLKQTKKKYIQVYRYLSLIKNIFMYLCTHFSRVEKLQCIPRFCVIKGQYSSLLSGNNTDLLEKQKQSFFSRFCKHMQVSHVVAYFLKREYHKIPKISPGLIFFKGLFWGAYFWRSLYFEGLIYRGKFAFQNRLG